MRLIEVYFIMPHPNYRVDLYPTDAQIRILDSFEIVQISRGDKQSLLLLRSGHASVVIAKDEVAGKIKINWANFNGYNALGILVD